MYETHRMSWTVEETAKMLRVHRDTVYDACASGQMPSYRIGNIIRIPSAALRMKYVPDEATRAVLSLSEDLEQLELPLDPSCLIPVRRYRNTREIINAWDYEKALWH